MAIGPPFKLKEKGHVTKVMKNLKPVKGKEYK